MRTIGLAVLAIAIAISAPAALAGAAERPFILWTAEDAEKIRHRMENEPWAAAEYERMRELRGHGQQFVRLFEAGVMGNEQVRQQERNYLLGFIGAPQGESRRHTMYFHALRYDILYDDLSDEQREGIERTFRSHIQFQLDNPRHETRISWLPNMQHPRMLGAHLMALALKDRELIEKIWSAPKGFKWYFDEYVADGHFYFEEFAKIDGTMSELLLFCRGLQRLGMDELGFGYVGRGGATMQRYVESLLLVGYPRMELDSGLHHYGMVTMGDARGTQLHGAPRFLAQHAIVPGAVVGDDPTGREFSGAQMQGRDHRNQRVAKIGRRHWYEIIHALDPEAGFDYFLAQMRQRGDDHYYPTLLWGLDPIDPEAVSPPPAPSNVFPERGFAMLRHDESPDYWESPDPAVSLQFAKLYVHYTSDCFSLLGYYAFNRPIYYNRTISRGYNGGPWDFHVRGHAGVVVDGLQAQPIGPVPVRHNFTEPMKFTHITTVGAEPVYTGRREVRSSDQPREAAEKVYPGVDLARGLMLTRQYLFDVFQVTADGPREIHWLVHALGEATPTRPDRWVETDHLRRSTLLDIPEVEIEPESMLDAGDEDWSLTTLQTCAIDIEDSVLGRDWYDRGVGVRIHMLGEPGTKAFFFESPRAYTPGSPRTPRADEREAFEAVSEVGGVSVAAERRTDRTTFVALHEPFEDGSPRIDRFERIGQSDNAVAVRVVGEAAGVDDRLLMAIAGDADERHTLADADESFTFTDHAFVRIRDGTVEMVGGLEAMRLRVEGSPRLIINGERAEARTDNGVLHYPAP